MNIAKSHMNLGYTSIQFNYNLTKMRPLNNRNKNQQIKTSQVVGR